MKRLIQILILLFVANIANANVMQDSVQIWYKQAQYQKVVDAYEQVLSEGKESATVYYNLGNAYYKLNNLPSAILNYEKALLLKPGDEDIKFNLELAKTYTVDDIEAIPEPFFVTWKNNLLNTFSSDQWAILCLVLFVVFLVFTSVYLYSRNLTFKKLGFWLAILGIVFSVVTFSFAYTQKAKYENRTGAIIFTPTITVKGSPDESGTGLFVIHEGTKVNITQALGEWIEVKIANGNKGWIKASDVQLI